MIPFVAGGSSDITGRAIASKFQEILGQPGVVAEVGRWTRVVQRGGITPD